MADDDGAGKRQSLSARADCREVRRAPAHTVSAPTPTCSRAVARGAAVRYLFGPVISRELFAPERQPGPAPIITGHSFLIPDVEKPW